MNRELIKRLSGHLADIIHCHRSSIRIENGITGISPLREISLKLLIGRGMPRQLFRRVHGLVCSTRRIILKTVRPPANSMPVTNIRAITSAASIMTRTITSMTSTVSRMTGIALGIMACAILSTTSVASRMSIAVASVTSTALTTSVALGIMACAILSTTSVALGTARVASRTASIASRTTRVILGAASIASRMSIAVRLPGSTIGTPSVILSTTSLISPPGTVLPARTVLGVVRIVSGMTSTVPGMVRTVRLTGTIVTTSTGLGTASIASRTTRVILGTASIASRTASLISPSSTVLPTRTVSGMTSTIPGMVRTVRLTGTIGMPIASRTTRVILGAASIVRRMSIAVTSVTSIALTASVALGIMACAILSTTSVALGTARTVRLPGTIGTTGTAISMGRAILGMTSLISPSGTVLPTRTVSGMTSIVRRMSIAVRLTGTVTSSTVVCATGATINVTGVISSRRTRIRRGLRRRHLCRRRRPSSTFASVHMRFRNTRIRDVTRSVRGTRRRRSLDIDVRSRPLGDEVRRVNVEIGHLQDLRRDLAGWDAYNRSNGIHIGQNLIRDLQTSADLRGGRPRLAELPNL